MKIDDAAPVTGEMLRDFVERLHEKVGLDDHPLTRLLEPLPDFRQTAGRVGDGSTLGGSVARWLRATWRQRFMPPVLNTERQVKWNAFFILEVMYFFPYATGRPFPGTLKDTGILLCDETHLALLLSDGDQNEADKLLASNQAFWKAFIPAAMIPAEQTLHSRRNASLAKLAKEINRQLVAAGLVAKERAAEAVQVGGERAEAQAPATSQERSREAGEQTGGSVGDVWVEAAAPDSARPDDPNARRLREALGDLARWRQPARAIAAPVVLTYPQERLRQLAERVTSITPTDLDELAIWLEALEFPQTFGVTQSWLADTWWWDGTFHQRALVEQFDTTQSKITRLQCAAALRQSSLAVLVESSDNLWPWGELRWVPAFQRVADIARANPAGSPRRELARAILARREFLMRLYGLGVGYRELFFEISNDISASTSHLHGRTAG